MARCLYSLDAVRKGLAELAENHVVLVGCKYLLAAHCLILSLAEVDLGIGEYSHAVFCKTAGVVAMKVGHEDGVYVFRLHADDLA